MMRIAVLLLAAVPACAAVSSPLEADFPAGYWERDTLYQGAAVTSYNISLAGKDPAALRSQVEAICKGAKATLAGFSDQTASLGASIGYSRLSAEYSHLSRTRMAYSLTYRMPIPKAGAVSRQIIELGRLISYTTNTPYGTSQQRELDEKIEWIEREQKEAGDRLKTMPVSRALLEARLKSLRQAKDAVKASEGVATVTVQIMLEEAEKADADK